MSIEKRQYSTPYIEPVCIDFEISLALESNPPVLPEEEANNISPDCNMNDSFKTWYS